MEFLILNWKKLFAIAVVVAGIPMIVARTRGYYADEIATQFLLPLAISAVLCLLAERGRRQEIEIQRQQIRARQLTEEHGSKDQGPTTSSPL